MKRKQLEIDEKKQSLAERQHQDFMSFMQTMQASTMKLMESVVQQINKKEGLTVVYFEPSTCNLSFAIPTFA